MRPTLVSHPSRPEISRKLASVCLVLAFTTEPLLLAQAPHVLKRYGFEPSLNCSQLSTINPNKSFLANFGNSCYAMPMILTNGIANGGDSNAHYFTLYYQTNPNFELVLTGLYPNARFFSAEVYDAHSVSVGALADYQIAPLNSSTINPFLPATSFVASQQYGIRVGLGGVMTATPSPGCSTAGTNIDLNLLGASQIHQGLTWDGYSPLPKNFPAHEIGSSSGGAILVRYYDPMPNQNGPGVIVRQVSDGCAVPLSEVSGLNLLTGDNGVGSAWANSQQITAHSTFASQIEPYECYPKDSANAARWQRSTDYVPGYDNFVAYLTYTLSTSAVSSLISNAQFIRLRFKMPTFPTTPCNSGTCTLTGNEQVRYRSLTFGSGNTTLVSIQDSDITLDPNGYATVIVGLGAQPPDYVNPANFYTYVDLSSIANYQSLTTVHVRDMLPNPSFECSIFNVPFRTTEYNPMGGFMGDYVPTVDYPTGPALPVIPTSHTRSDTCGVVPTSQPVTCSAN